MQDIPKARDADSINMLLFGRFTAKNNEYTVNKRRKKKKPNQP